MCRYVNNLREYQEILTKAGDKLVVVDFTASWCGPCKMIGPKFDMVSRLPANSHVLFFKVDVDNAPDVAAHCGIRSMPTFKFYKNGVVVYELVGADEKKLIQEIEQRR